MGGFGSGNRSQRGRRLVGDYPELRISTAKRYGLFDEPDLYTCMWIGPMSIEVDTREAGVLHLSYENNGSDWSYSVMVDETHMHFGGFRRWFLCPNPECAKRCTSLHLRDFLFLCRVCHNLGYRSEQASKIDQPLIRIQKIRKNLGWESGLLSGIGERSKYMQRRRFLSLVEQHKHYSQQITQTLLSTSKAIFDPF